MSGDAQNVSQPIVLTCHADYVRHFIKPALRAGYAFPIMPRRGVYLWAFDGDGSRLASLFLSTWKRLPLWARRPLLAFWRRGHPVYGDYKPSPQVELLQGWPGREGDDDAPSEAMACVTHAGHLIRFHAPSVDRMPDPVVCDLVAHELAHAYQYALGATVAWDLSPGEVDLLDGDGDGSVFLPGEMEEDAEMIMSGWGFDPESIDRWTVAEGIVQRRLLSPEEFAWAYNHFMRTGRYSLPPRDRG
jgi:hypothetical protein